MDDFSPNGIAPDLNDEVLARLAKIEQMLDTISRLACPVCAPAVIAANHPEVEHE